jgi:predicted AlkP superfamily pyrophosphatase or phosphodiesterase
MLQSGAVTEEEIRGWSKTNNTLHDDVWMRAAVHIIEKHKPNLLLLHLLLTDSAQHNYGAGSLGANAALILADRQLQRILDAVNRAGIRESTTLFVVSDHGFKTYRHVVRPNVVLRQKGLLRTQQDCDGWVIPEGGTAMVYVTREERRAAVLAAMRQPLQGVARVMEPAEYAKWGLPAPSPGGRMSDLMLVAEPGYAFEGAVQGDPVSDTPAPSGAHGYLNSDPDMEAILVAWGAGIRSGARTGPKPNVDVAATIARLLGVELPGIAGRPLAEFLNKSASAE